MGEARPNPLGGGSIHGPSFPAIARLASKSLEPCPLAMRPQARWRASADVTHGRRPRSAPERLAHWAAPLLCAPPPHTHTHTRACALPTPPAMRAPPSHLSSPFPPGFNPPTCTQHSSADANPSAGTPPRSTPPTTLHAPSTTPSRASRTRCAPASERGWRPTRIRAHVHARTSAHTHARTHAYTHTHKTHTLPYPTAPSQPPGRVHRGGEARGYLRQGQARGAGGWQCVWAGLGFSV